MNNNDEDGWLIRKLRDSDIGEIDKFYRKFYENDFYIPSLENSITHAVVENANHEILGFGMVKAFAEAIMVLDLDRSNRVKARTMNVLMMKAIHDSRYHGLEQLHVSVNNETFAEVLHKHYDFNKVKNIIMVRKLK